MELGVGSHCSTVRLCVLWGPMDFQAYKFKFWPQSLIRMHHPSLDQQFLPTRYIWGSYHITVVSYLYGKKVLPHIPG